MQRRPRGALNIPTSMGLVVRILTATLRARIRPMSGELVGRLHRFLLASSRREWVPATLLSCCVPSASAQPVGQLVESPAPLGLKAALDGQRPRVQPL